MTPKFRLTLPTILASLLVCAPTLALAAPRVVDRVAALVNEEMIPLSEIYERAMPLLVQMEQEGKLSTDRRKAVLKAALEECIAERLLMAEQKSLGIEITDAEVDDAVDNVRRQNRMDAETFEKALQSQGMDMAAYREKLRQDLAAMRLITFKVRSKIKVSDEDIQAEYARMERESQSDFEVRARHIVIQVEKNAGEAAEKQALARAQELSRRAKAGEDFETLARTHSESASKEMGGDLGFFKRGDMVAAFERVAFAQAPGEISEPIRTPFGWHIIQTIERRARALPPLESLRSQIEDKLSRAQMQRQTEQYVAELRSKAEVVIKVDDLK
ncbi:MAG: peptidylprolyl isomerase [Myxococcales bacterium]|jgi:peptidyl-prolyl cis-trans isomerase SurA|nr:peptidylprolyl isomerase [Myxococcales bacterium]